MKERDSPSSPQLIVGVFEAGWSSEDLMVKHRTLVAADHQGGRGRAIIALDWTLSHHERGPQIHRVK